MSLQGAASPRRRPQQIVIDLPRPEEGLKNGSAQGCPGDIDGKHETGFIGEVTQSRVLASVVAGGRVEFAHWPVAAALMAAAWRSTSERAARAVSFCDAIRVCG